MSDELIVSGQLPACSMADLAMMDRVIDEVANLPPVDIAVDHFLHAGMYVRTCMIPKNCVIVGALIKIPTVVTVSGHCKVTVGSKTAVVNGYAVLRADAGRRQAFLAYEDTFVTMAFASKAKTVKDAEKEFTDEWALLTTNKETACQA